MSPTPDPRTLRGQVGRQAESVARGALMALGWRVLANNLEIGRDEIDLVCLDAAIPMLVFVEVRGHSTSRFGAAEESLDRRKIGRTYRAALAVIRSGWPREHGLHPGISWRVDVVAVELAPMLARNVGGPVIHHLRGVTLD